MKQQSPMLRLWELGEGQQGGLKRAVLSAVVGVLFGMLPYFAVAQIILGLLSGNQESSFYLTWCAVALVGFLLRATLYSLALSQSHKATFAILKLSGRKCWRNCQRCLWVRFWTPPAAR